ncbi:MAG: MBOAT family protein [Hyphomonas sp.]|nr:MBOAT family protein [Hyphomonas sp.]
MLFNSVEFVFGFVPIVFIAYLLARQVSSAVAKVTILIASLFFYSWWKLEYLPILLGSILVNYVLYRIIIRCEGKRRHAYTLLGVAFNILLIAYYKYIGFILYGVLGLDYQTVGIEVPILPLAISFFTFQQLSFLIDANRSDDEYVSLLDYSCYVSFFPQLIAGPIVRHNELIPQLKSPKFERNYLEVGILLFAIGLFKKVIIADGMAVWASQGFSSVADLTTSDSWVAALSYTFQLYFDFSGYSDMAIGLGLMFGFKLPMNFDSPYKAVSIADFWRRWHITLSNWLRDYLYIPLGGNRQGSVRTYVNLLLTMLIGGIWHGAGWTFVVWGALHGLALAAHRLWSKLNIGLSRELSVLTTFMFVVVGWVIFRAASMEDAATVLTSMFGFSEVTIPNAWANAIAQIGGALRVTIDVSASSNILPLHAWGVIVVLCIAVLKLPNSMQIMEASLQRGVQSRRAWLYVLVGIGFGLSVKRMMETSVPSEFLYFQF